MARKTATNLIVGLMLVLCACDSPTLMRLQSDIAGVSYSTVKDTKVPGAYIARCVYDDAHDYQREQLKAQTILNGLQAAQSDGYDYVAWEGPLNGDVVTTTTYAGKYQSSSTADGYAFIVRGWKAAQGKIPSTAHPIATAIAEMRAQLARVTQPAAGSTATLQFTWPVDGPVVVPFGKANTAIKIQAEPGTIVKAAEGGVVEFVTAHGLGIDHALGYRSYYTCANAVQVKEGDRVASGQPIASVGIPGTCREVPGSVLGFSIYRNKRFLDPVATLPKR